MNGHRQTGTAVRVLTGTVKGCRSLRRRTSARRRQGTVKLKGECGIRGTAWLQRIWSNGWRAGAPFTAGTPNFEVAMREWNHSEVYRKTIVLMAQRLGGG
jgi:membrane-bound lytic murein transglycosylase B